MRRRRSSQSRRRAAGAAASGDGVVAAVQDLRSTSENNNESNTTSEESRIRELEERHARDMALVKHQHDQYVRSLKQNYELRIQKIKEAQSNRHRALQQDVTDQNRQAIEQMKQKTDLETNQEIERLRHELAQQVAQQTEAYDHKVQELHQHKALLAASRQENIRLQQEHDQSRHDLEQMHDTQDELAATKAQLKALKTEYQANMKDLQTALEVSQEHLQVNYELLSSLKADKHKLVAEVERLQKVLGEQESGVRDAVSERKKLERQAQMNEVDTRSYKERMERVVQQEQTQAQAAQATHQQLAQHKDHIDQCAAAIRQAQEQMEVEKTKHLALRQDYQDHADRLQALNEALERCKQKNISTNEILKEMNDRYAELKARTEALMNEYTAYRREHEATHHMSASVALTPAEAEEHAQRLGSLHAHAHNSLEACQQKCSTCLDQSRQQEAYIQKLEDEIRKALRVIRGKESAGTLTADEVIVREHALRDLQRDLERVKAENDSLKDRIKSFADHQDVDARMARRHSNLKSKHAMAMQWIDEMKTHHNELHDVKARLAQEIEQVGAKLNAGEEAMQRAAQTIRGLEKQVAEQREKAAQCLYPGERDRLTAQVEEVLRDRNSLREKMTQATSEHARLNQRLQDLTRENEELRVIKQRFEIDAEQMQRIVSQSSELNVELVNARRLLDKKEKQMELLSGQLATMIHRVKTLEERERGLEEKLQQSTGPDEVETLMKHLSACRSEMKTYTGKYAAMQAASEMMKAQLRTNQAKVEALMQVIKESEHAQEQWHHARQEQEQLQAALKDCSQQRHVTSEQLQQRIQAMEEVYGQSVQSHERLMAESNARIAELQQQLLRASHMQKSVVSGVTLKPEQMPLMKDERVSVVESRIDEVAQRAKAEIAALAEQEQVTQNPVATTEAAIRATQLESVADLQRLKALHQQSMRDKERQIMATRDETYDKLLATLDVANRDSNVRPEDLYAQIRDIRVRGAAREQQVMADMLRLRAINARLSAEYQAARAAQAELLHKANVVQRQQILQVAGDAPPSLLQQNAQAYQALMGAHRDFILSGSRDVGTQLAEQSQYIRELERQYPKMEAVVASTNLQRFPNLDVLQNQVAQEKKFTVGAINFERREAVGQDRTQSALEAQLKAADASVRAMTDMVKRYVSQPTPDNLTNLRSMAQMSPGQIQEEQKRQAELQDRSAVRSQAVIQPRRPQDGPPGTGLAADMSTGEIQTRSVSSPPQAPPTRYFHNSVSVFGEPTKTFAPTVERAVTQWQNDQDLVVLTYSFELSSQTDRPLKYVLFEHALRAMFPRIQQLTRNGKLELQLVRILPGNGRLDVFANAMLPQGCTYATCPAQKMEVSDISSVDRLVAQLKVAQFQGEAENHMVLTVGAPGSSGHVHITDVLFVPTPNAENPVPVLENIRLLDGSWRNYLVDVLQKPKTKIDLIFNVVPHTQGDTEAQEANHRLLQVADRIQTYLRQVKGNQ